jgi:hypothetical protein
MSGGFAAACFSTQRAGEVHRERSPAALGKMLSERAPERPGAVATSCLSLASSFKMTMAVRKHCFDSELDTFDLEAR